MEGLYCLCSKNKGADQLSSYCTAPLFSHIQKAGFLITRLKDRLYLVFCLLLLLIITANFVFDVQKTFLKGMAI